MNNASISGTARSIRTLLLIMTVAGLAAACGSDDDDDNPNAGTDGGGGDGMLGTATLDQVVAQPLNSEPINDGLDQVEADLLNTLGPPDSEPFTVGDDDTVESLL